MTSNSKENLRVSCAFEILGQLKKDIFNECLRGLQSILTDSDEPVPFRTEIVLPNADVELLLKRAKTLYRNGGYESFLFQFNSEKFVLICLSNCCSEFYLKKVSERLFGSYLYKVGLRKNDVTLKSDVMGDKFTVSNESECFGVDVLSQFLAVDDDDDVVASVRGRFVFEVETDLTKKLENIAENSAVKEWSLLFAVFKVLLARYSRQSKFQVLCESDKEGLLAIPFFVNCDVDLRLSLMELINAENESEANVGAGVGIVAEVTANAVNAPTFSYLDTSVDSGLKFKQLFVPEVVHKRSLSLKLNKSSNSIKGVIEYKNINETTVANMAAHFSVLLKNALSNPDHCVAQLNMITPSERSELDLWNRTEIEPHAWTCIQTAFEGQVKQKPDDVALVCGEEKLTYRELNLKANALAVYLLNEAKVKRLSVIAIAIPKSIQLVAAILGVLKANCSYVLLDLEHPKSRLDAILNDADCVLAIVNPDCDSSKIEIAKLFYDESVVFDRNANNAELPDSTGGDIAYFVYTSGTTGTPKGIPICHKNLLALIHGMKSISNEEDWKGVALLASVNNSLLSALIFYALLTGGKGVIFPTLLHLPTIPAKNEVTSVITAPAPLIPLLVEGTLPSSVRQIIIGGDMVPEKVITLIRQLPNGNNIKLFNSHGCSENTVFDAISPLRNFECHVFLKRPFPNNKLYIVDEYLNLVPRGVKGELCVAGHQVVPRYNKRPELTSTRFVANPFDSSKLGYERIYRTGDLSLQRHDGMVEILGRIDFQVKINGVRIELDEITSVALSNPRIHEAVTVVTKSEIRKANKEILTLYFCTKQVPPLTNDDVRIYLESKIPRHMVPGLYVRMDALPRNQSNKVDRALLPVPKEDDSNDEYERTQPETELERKVLKFVNRILGNDNVGVLENLLNLGMESISAIRLSIEISDLLKKEFQVQYIFENPTVADLCKLIEDGNVGKNRDKVDVKSEAILNNVATIAPTKPISVSKARHVFLTGSTGFIGGFLLHDLLQNTKAKIHCLVRASDSESGMKRIESNLAKYNLKADKMNQRVKAYIGSLNEDKLGLTSEHYDWLCSNLDVIFHCAAPVNFVMSYKNVREVAVKGTNEIVNMAASRKIKVLHFLSSVAVYGSGSKPETKHETGNLDDFLCDLPDMGYAQMKWVSEKIVRTAAGQGLPVTIIRPSNVFGHRKNGAISSEEYVCRMIKSCIQLRCYPDVNTGFWLIPVSYVIDVIRRLSGDDVDTCVGKVFNLAPDVDSDPTISDVMTYLQDLGYQLEKLPYKEWYRRLVADVGETGGGSEDNALLPLIQFVSNVGTQNEFAYDSTNTKAIMKRSKSTMTSHNNKVDKVLIKKVIEYLVSVRFIEKPNPCSKTTKRVKLV